MGIESDLEEKQKNIEQIEQLEQDARALERRISVSCYGEIDAMKDVINVLNAQLDTLYKEKGRIERDIKKMRQR